MVLGRGRGRAPPKPSPIPGGLSTQLAESSGAAKTTVMLETMETTETKTSLEAAFAKMQLGGGIKSKSPGRSTSSGVSSESEESSIQPPLGMGRGRGRQSRPSLRTMLQTTHIDPISKTLHPSKDSATESSAENQDVGAERELSVGPTMATEVLPGGRKGRKVDVSTNLYDIEFPKEIVVHRYRVDITKRNLRTESEFDMGKGAGNDHMLNRKREQSYFVFQRAKITNHKIFPEPKAVAFDRRNLAFAMKKLDFGGGLEDGELIVEFKKGELFGSDDPHRFKITIKYESQLDLTDLQGLTTHYLEDRNREVIQCLEVLFQQNLYDQAEHLVHFGPKSYERKSAKDLGNGRYLARGMHKSVMPTTDADGSPKLAITADNKNAAFYTPGPVIQTLCEVLGRSQRRRYTPEDFKRYGLREAELRDASHYLRDVSVKDMAAKRPFTVAGISKDPANELRVTFADEKRGGMEREITLASYYRQRHNYDLKYPALQCLYSRGRDGRKIYVPMEVCNINDAQRVPLNRQTPDMMQQMIRESALKPSDLQANLARKIEDTKLLSNAYLAEFGLRLKSKARVVSGRIVPKPEIAYGNGVGRVDQMGNWKQGRSRFHTPGTCKGWAVVCVARIQNHDIKTLGNFTEKLTNEARSKGLNLPTASCLSKRPDQVETAVKEVKDKGCDFVVFIISDDKLTHTKDLIKLGEARHGVITQCVTLSKALQIGRDERGAYQVSENILAKTNLKLGGLNYELRLSPEAGLGPKPRWLQPGKVLILGADVNHPPPQPAHLRHLPPRSPSVVGFVGNGAKSPLLFTGEISFQNAREEMVKEMGDLTEEFLRRWKREQKRLPDEVIYFRDGVSDGQFKAVLEQEAEPLRTAFKRISQDSMGPKITVIVAKKRHHFRMFASRLDPRAKASQQDLEPGTVLDSASGVTHPGQANFFLKSHLALQGTARATHYSTILNEGGFDQDELDQLVFALAHNHQIVTKSVSLPAPVYGAHEMAERGKRLWRAEYEDDENSSVSTPSSAPRIDFAEATHKLRVGKFTRLYTAKHWA